MFMRKLAIVLAAFAAAATPAAAANAPPCAAAEFHQLDFWIGQWTVYEKDTGKQSSTSRIENVMGGCGIAEHYEEPGDPAGPYSGTSYSSFNREDGKWHQMYIDTNGIVEWFSGGLDASGDMVMEAPGAKNIIRKMVYHKLPDGSVEQIGTASTDSGKQWKPRYDYIYRKG
jgi:hypothetical protein